MEDEDSHIEDAENIRKQGQTYQSFLYQTLIMGTRRLSMLFQMQNSPENNAAIRQEVFNIHLAITFRKASMDYSENFYPAIRKEVEHYENMANTGSGNLNNNSRQFFQTSIQKWLDRLTFEARRNRFTPPESGTLVIGNGVTNNPRANKVRSDSGKNVV
jgi:hypothetical protein